MRSAIGDRLLFAVTPPLGAAAIRLVRRLMPVEIVGEEHPFQCWTEGQKAIFTLWHDQLFLMPTIYRGQGAKVLISASKDGELLARTMHSFGFDAVRGSSSRGGRAAFRALLDLSREPFDLALTPDGPKGPRHQLKDGVVQLARLSGRPVIPLAFACSRGHRFASWDRFLLPYPFSRGVFSYGPPLRFSEGETPEEFRTRLQLAMDENNRRAAARLEELGVSAV